MRVRNIVIIFWKINLCRIHTELWVDGKTLRTLCVEVTYFTTLYLFGVSMTVFTVKNMGLARQKHADG